MRNCELENDSFSNYFSIPIPDKLLKTAEESRFFRNRNRHSSRIGEVRRRWLRHERGLPKKHLLGALKIKSPQWSEGAYHVRVHLDAFGTKCRILFKGEDTACPFWSGWQGGCTSGAEVAMQAGQSSSPCKIDWAGQPQARLGQNHMLPLLLTYHLSASPFLIVVRFL